MTDDKGKITPDIPSNASLLELNVDEIASPALARLIEEVRNDEPPKAGAYNRSYHRHNR